MVKRLVILPTLQKTLAAATTLAADADVTGQTLTPSNYVGFPDAGTDAMTYVRVGKPQVVQTLEVVLVDLFTRPWPVLQRSVNGSPLAAHDATHQIETVLVPDGLAQLVGAWLGAGAASGSLVANVDDLFFDGAAFTLVAGSGGVRIGLSASSGSGAGSGGGGGGGTSSRATVSTAAVPAPKRIRAAVALALASAQAPL